eukprot:192420-Rhodomonas_salina.1
MPTCIKPAHTHGTTIAHPTADMPCKQKNRSIDIPGVGVCMAVTDLFAGYSGKNPKAITETFNLPHIANKPEVIRLTSRLHQFPGRGQKEVPIVTQEEALELADHLPKSYSTHLTKHIVEQFNRMASGDQTLHEEIDNAEQKHDIASTANTVSKKRKASEPDFEPEHPGFVYAAYSQGNGVKVGMTRKKNPYHRVVAFNTCVKHPYQFTESIYCANPEELERFMHQQLKDHSVGQHNQELFDVDIKTAKKLFSMTREAMDFKEVGDGGYIDTKWLTCYFVVHGFTVDSTQ